MFETNQTSDHYVLRVQGCQVISMLSSCLRDCVEVSEALMVNLKSPESSFAYYDIAAVLWDYTDGRWLQAIV